MLNMKRCIGECQELKPITEFYKNRKQCKNCIAEQRKKKRNKEKEINNIKQDIKSETEPETETEKIDVEIKEEQKEIENKEIINNEIQKNILLFGIKQLIEMIFIVISLRAGEHWRLKKEEIEMLSSPISNIVNKLSYATTITQNMDYVNLSFAVFSIFGGRIQQTISMKGGKKNVENIPRPAAKTNNNRTSEPIKNRDTKESNIKEQIKNVSSSYDKKSDQLEYNEQLLDDIL